MQFPPMTAEVVQSPASIVSLRCRDSSKQTPAHHLSTYPTELANPMRSDWALTSPDCPAFAVCDLPEICLLLRHSWSVEPYVDLQQCHTTPQMLRPMIASLQRLSNYSQSPQHSWTMQALHRRNAAKWMSKKQKPCPLLL